MVIKVHGALSSATQRVVAVLLEKELPYEIINLDFTSGRHKSPEWLQYHPFGQSPYIDDDGFTLYESRAICHYIAYKYQDQGTQGLIPTDPHENGKFHAAVSVEMCHIDGLVSAMAMERIYKVKYYNQVTDDAAYAAAEEALGKKLDVYDKILSTRRYIAGDTFTLADINHLPWFVILNIVGSNVVNERPNVKRRVIHQ